MEHRTKSLKITSILASAVLSMGLLSGCANPLEQLAQGGIENMIKDQIKEQTGVDIDINITGGELPASWPAVVPPPTGYQLTFAAGASDSGWTANYEVPNKSHWENYIKTLEAAGFTLNHTTDLGEKLTGGVLEGHGHGLVVNYLGDDDKGMLSIVVTVSQ